MRENKAFSDSYCIKAHDQISESKDSLLEPELERRSVDPLEEGDPPFRDPSDDQWAKCRLSVQSLDGLGYEHLGHDPKLTVQLHSGWHHMPLGL